MSTGPEVAAVALLERRYSAAELCFLTGIAPSTLDLYLRDGVLKPSIQRAGGRGRGHVFDIADVVSGRTMQSLRIPNATSAPLRHLVAFWHSKRGRAWIRDVASPPYDDGPRIVVVSEHGVETDTDSRTVHAKHQARVVFSIDARPFIDDLVVARTEDIVLGAFPEPLASGRRPERGPRKKKTERSKVPARGKKRRSS